MIEFKIPDLGENIKSASIVNILVKVGDTVKKDQDLLELETEKASIPIPSPANGVIKEILVKTGQSVQIGAVVMRIEAGAGAAAKETSSKPSAPAAATVAAAKTSVAVSALKTDPASTAPMPILGAQKDVPAAPSVRRFAREIGINISQVPGTGPGGRISLEDVKAYSKMLNAGGRGLGGVATPARQLPDFNKFGSTQRQPMNNIRKKTAEHLTYCWNTIPHVTQFDRADITELEKLRKQYTTNDRKLTVTPFLLKILASALKTFPQFNASVDMATNEIIYKEYFHMGIAVDTDRGLIVPVLRDIDKKNIFEITDELNVIAEKARTKKTTLDEMQGGCMTLTNLGGIGGTFFTPIVNWPEVSILGVSRGRWEPVYENGNFIPRFVLPLSLSYDHRIIDGADGARFLRWVCEAIEQPSLIALNS
jgi:pyruvate dehydrogenase E2 component (dihydrolipoamide acetyltransferase)